MLTLAVAAVEWVLCLSTRQASFEEHPTHAINLFYPLNECLLTYNEVFTHSLINGYNNPRNILNIHKYLIIHLNGYSEIYNKFIILCQICAYFGLIPKFRSW